MCFTLYLLCPKPDFIEGFFSDKIAEILSIS